MTKGTRNAIVGWIHGQPSDKKPFTREMFFATPIFFKDLPNSKELNKQSLKNILNHGRKEMKKVLSDQTHLVGIVLLTCTIEKNIIL